MLPSEVPRLTVRLRFVPQGWLGAAVSFRGHTPRAAVQW
jgi:hypothetical protein